MWQLLLISNICPSGQTKVYEITRATQQELVPLRKRQPSLEMQQLLTTPLNPLNMPVSNAEQEGSIDIRGWEGRKHLENSVLEPKLK